MKNNEFAGHEVINIANQSRAIDTRSGDPMLSATGATSVPLHPELYEVIHNRASNGRGLDARRLGWWLRRIKGKIHKVDGKKYRIMDKRRAGDRALTWYLEEV